MYSVCHAITCPERSSASHPGTADGPQHPTLPVTLGRNKQLMDGGTLKTSGVGKPPLVLFHT